MSSDLKDIISATGTIVQSLSAIVVLVVAICGLRTWRRQMIGEKRYEAVHRLLLLARQFRGAFAKSRGIFTYQGEAENRPRNSDETAEQAKMLDERFARLTRLQPAIDLIHELEQAAWEVEVLTGDEIVPLAQPFGQTLSELINAIYGYTSYRLEMLKKPTGLPPEPTPASISDYHKLIYQPQSDELTNQIDDTFEALEKKLRKYIR